MKKLIVLMTVLVALAGFTLFALQSGSADDLDSPAAKNAPAKKAPAKKAFKG